MDALGFWNEWVSEHPEHKKIIESHISALEVEVNNTTKGGYVGMETRRKRRLGRSESAEILLQLVAHKILPLQDTAPAPLTFAARDIYSGHGRPTHARIPDDVRRGMGLSEDIRKIAGWSE